MTMNIETCLEKYSDEFYSLMYGVNDSMSQEESMKKVTRVVGTGTLTQVWVKCLSP